MMSVPQALAMAWQNYQAGHLEQAEQLCRQILQVDANQVDALHFLGVISLLTGRDNLAVDYLHAALRLKPDCAEAHNNLGNVFINQRELPKAVASCQQAVRIKPSFAEAHHNLGIALREQGQLTEAVASLEQALRLKPDYAEAHNNLGIALQGQGKLAEAVVSFEQALRLRPDYAEAHNNLGNVLLEKGKAEEALDSFQQAVRIKPDFAEAHNNLGIAFREQGQLRQAVASWEQAVRLKPHHAEVYNNLGIALREQGQLREAVASLQQALRLKPNYAEAHNNLGNVLLEQGKPEEALDSYQQGVRLKSHYAEVHYNLSMLWLLLGNFEQGWPEYEWRRRTKGVSTFPKPQPPWDGRPLHGKTILLHAEQGLGDTLQFIRYAAVVKQRGGTVVVECHPSLLGVLAGCAGIDQLLPQGGPLPAYDVQAPLLSLPGLCGTTLATIPATVPYLVADRFRVEYWRDRLAAVSGFKVGICWQGDPGHKNDRRRSVPLAQFAPLAKVPGLRLVNLQKGSGSEQWTALAGHWPVVDLPGQAEEPSQAWVDTAALVCALDLVITVDTAVAHLAGALGVPVWVALPFSPDWRWLLGREDSPWYPTMRLFRQTRHGHWPDVFERIAVELQRAKVEKRAHNN